MPQGRITEDEVRITQATPGVTLSAGVANQRSLVAEFVVADRTAYIIRPGDVFSLHLADTTPTELAGTSQVELVHTDPNGVVTRQLVLADYTVLREFVDRNLLFTFGKRTHLRPDDRVRIYVTGNLAAATAQTRFQISALRGASVGTLV